MTTPTPVWVTAYGGSYPGATPMYRSSDPSATPIQIVGYGTPPSGGVPSGVTPIWVSTPQASGAVAASVVTVGGAWSAAAPSSTWSSADATAGSMTLTNSGATVAPGTSGWHTIRSSASKTSGKLYVELANGATSANGVVFGLASSSINISSYLGASTYSIGFALNGAGTIVSAGFTSNYAMPTITPGATDVWALAVDFGVGLIWIAQNNVWVNSGNPATGTAATASFVPATVGALFAGMSFNATGNGVWTIQPTAASQKYASPSGFTAWG